MSDQDQEPEMENAYFHDTDEDCGLDSGSAVNRLAMLRLNSFSTNTTVSGGDHHHRTATTTNAPVSSVKHCNLCGGSTKRRSPSSSSSLQEPKSKKITRHPSSSSTVAVDEGDHLHLESFTKLPLPISSPIVWALPPTSNTTPSMPTLRRCISDPIHSQGTNNAGASGAQLSDSSAVSRVFMKPLSPENAKIDASATTPSPAKAISSTSATLSPLPPILRRSVSDPSPAAHQVMTTPPNSIKGQSPNSKRLNRMRERMREMSQWWDEVMREEGEKEGSSEDDNNGAPKVESEETECEEAVSVERSGKCLIIHIKCPCGKGYQIIISGNNCYYKLM